MSAVSTSPDPAGPAADRRLLELMTLVEKGAAASPHVSIFASSWIFRGQLTSTHWFLETTRKHRQEALEQSRDYKKADPETRRQQSESLNAELGLFGSPEHPDITAVNLVYVTAVNPAGATALIPAVRIPLTSVSSWSAVDFVLPKPAGGGGGIGVGVGVAMPIG